MTNFDKILAKNVMEKEVLKNKLRDIRSTASSFNNRFQEKYLIKTTISDLKKLVQLVPDDNNYLKNELDQISIVPTDGLSHITTEESINFLQNTINLGQLIDVMITRVEKSPLERFSIQKETLILTKDDASEKKEIMIDEVYDIVISFAGEDRTIAEKIAKKLKTLEYNVFYDKYEQATLWGKDLYEHLSDIYSKKGKFCLMIISKHYAEKNWTNHERKAAQARAFEQSKEYILPLKLDDTEIPGLHSTTGYLDYRMVSLEDIVACLKFKLDNL